MGSRDAAVTSSEGQRICMSLIMLKTLSVIMLFDDASFQSVEMTTVIDVRGTTIFRVRTVDAYSAS